MSAIHTILDMAVDSMSQLADANIVTGKAVQVGDKTIVPILKLSVGMGGGGGQGEGEGKDTKHANAGKGTGMGSAAGGSVQLSPMAVIVKDKNSTKILKVPHPKGSFEKLIDKVPGFVEKIKAVASSN
ncbi:MAG: spore germination protein GerW family protein [Myxococcota bacterium]|nr:spore germination protein GerW family protein [Myxococcota bacterium]